MVLDALRMPPLDEQTLSMVLGLRVPSVSLSDYPGAIPDDDPTSHGIRLRDVELSRLKNFLQQFGFRLTTSFHPASDIQRDDFAEYISNLMSGEKVLIVGYNYKTVFEKGEGLGHMGVITNVSTARGQIELVEPEEGIIANVDEVKLYAGAAIFKSGIWAFEA